MKLKNTTFLPIGRQTIWFAQRLRPYCLCRPLEPTVTCHGFLTIRDAC